MWGDRGPVTFILQYWVCEGIGDLLHSILQYWVCEGYVPITVIQIILLAESKEELQFILFIYLKKIVMHQLVKLTDTIWLFTAGNLFPSHSCIGWPKSSPITGIRTWVLKMLGAYRISSWMYVIMYLSKSSQGNRSFTRDRCIYKISSSSNSIIQNESCSWLLVEWAWNHPQHHNSVELSAKSTSR